VAIDTNGFDHGIEDAQPFVRLMMVNENDRNATGDMPMGGIHTHSIGMSVDRGEREVKKTGLSIALPVPLTMAELQERGLGVCLPDAGSVSSAARAARRYVEHSRARSTIKTYELWWRLIVRICAEWGACALPMDPGVAVLIPAEMAERGYEWKSIKGACNALRLAHRFAGLADPTQSAAIQAVLRGIGRVIGTAPKRQKVAIVADELRLLARAAARRPWPRGAQEWALMAVGYFCALRRSEIVALDVDDLTIDSDVLRVSLVKSKTDQFGRGDEVLIERLKADPELCPVAAVEAWLAILDEPHGPLFRRLFPGNHVGGRLSDRTVARVAQRFAADMGLCSPDVGAHSLRAGCVTQMKLEGVDDVTVAAHTRHQTLDSLSTYNRPRDRRTNYAKLLAGRA
jgi:integrase